MPDFYFELAAWRLYYFVVEVSDFVVEVSDFVVEVYMDWSALLSQVPVLESLLAAADADASVALLRSCRPLAAASRDSPAVRLAVWMAYTYSRGFCGEWGTPASALRLAVAGNDVGAVRLLMGRHRAALMAPATLDNEPTIAHLPAISDAGAALCDAARRGSLEMVRLLREEFDVPIPNITLMRCIRHEDIVRYLLGAGVEVSLVEVHEAIQRASVGALRLFREYGVEMDDSLFIVAMYHCDLAVVRFLVEEVGLVPGATELAMAEKRGALAVVEYLRPRVVAETGDVQIVPMT